MICKKKLYTLSLIPLAALMFLYQSASNAHASKANIMIFQHADVGTISQEKTNLNCYQIQLSGLKEQVIYFATEPSRNTGTMTWADYALTWMHNEVKPNAVIHAQAGKNAVNDMVALSNFQYDKSNQSASYKACALDIKSKFATGKLSDISLFIDPFHPWP